MVIQRRVKINLEETLDLNVGSEKILNVIIVISLVTIKKLFCAQRKREKKEDALRKSQDEKSSVVSVSEEAFTSYNVLSIAV